MKKIGLLILSLACFYFCSCKEKDNGATDGGDDIDKTTNCKSPTDTGGYLTFFKPAVGWFGDPIPFSDNGKFYIFYLQDWRSGWPQLHPWHMISSDDLSSFKFEGEIIPCGEVNDQDVSLCTGGVIKSREDGKYYAFYAGHRIPMEGKPLQAVMLTTSPDMKTWTKDPSFFLSISGDGYNQNDFRDPHLYFDEESNVYKMIITTQRNGKATLALYTSTNLRDWTLQQPFYTDQNESILECADVFKEGDYWYLIYSNVRDRKVHYRYSTSQNGPWLKPANPILDGLAFYAGKTASNGTDRYIFGWCPTRIGDGEPDQWGGSMVYHRILPQADGTLKVGIPQGLNNKFSKEQEIADIDRGGIVNKNEMTFKLSDQSFVTFPRLAKPCKIETTVKANSNTDVFGFTFGACGVKDEVYSIRFDLQNKSLAMYKDLADTSVKQTEVELNVPDDLTFNIKIVTEKTVNVVYVNEESALTNRINKMMQNPWNIFSENGNSITFSSVKLFEQP